MKIQDLKIGKWYRNIDWVSNSYARLKKVGSNRKYYFSEAYIDGEYLVKDDWWSGEGSYIEVSTKKLSKFLPYKLELDYEIY